MTNILLVYTYIIPQNAQKVNGFLGQFTNSLHFREVFAMGELMLYGQMKKINAAVVEADARTIVGLNLFTASRGLRLSETAARGIAQTRLRAISENGRVELGAGIVEKIMLVFADSRYVQPEDWEELIHTLVENFYFIKTDTHDTLSDNEVIKYMLDEFEGECEGSLTLLCERIEAYMRRMRGDAYFCEEEADDE